MVKAVGLGGTSKPLRWRQDAKIIVLQEDRREMTHALNVKSGEQRRASSNPKLLFEGGRSGYPTENVCFWRQ